MVDPGSILITEVGGDLKAAVALSEDRGTLDVLLTGGARQKLKSDKIVRVSSRHVRGSLGTAAAAVAEAEGYLADVTRAADGIDMHGLWEVLVEEGSAWSLHDMAELAVTDGGTLAHDAMALALYRDRTYFKARKDGLVPNPRRTVEAVTAQQRAEEAARREETEAALALGELLEAGATLPAGVSSTIEVAVRLLREHAMQSLDATRERKAQALLHRLYPERPDGAPYLAFQTLVRLGVFEEDENLDILKHRIPLEFSSAVEGEAVRIAARGIPAELLAGSGREDLRALVSVAIDDADTREVDDALAVEVLPSGLLRVHVLISDASELVPLNGEVGGEARRRASTLYLPDRTIPMIPRPLSEGILSLEAAVDRLVLDFRMDVDPSSGAVADFTILEAVARVAARLTYVRADAILEGREESEYEPLLRSLVKVGQALRGGRRAAGAVLIQQAEVKVKATDAGVTVERIDRSSPSRELVAELMIGACANVGAYCHEQGIPAVYRNQDSPEDPLDLLPEQAADPVLIAEVLRRMRRADLSLSPDRHYGLGVGAYTQVTSPIRRYQDLVMHSQIKGYLRDGVAPLGEKEILHVFGEVESTAAIHNRIERDAKRYFILKHLRERRGEAIDAIAVREQGSRVILELSDFGLQVPFTPTASLTPGDRFRAIVSDADPRRDRLVLQEER